ncbi:MAG: outer membrane lipoprotein-sorting protein, partial [Nannocystaceae bacterium]
VDRDLFTYLSKTDRTIKISGAMMGGSWMGSHFTNDDLVRSNRFSEDFDVTLSGRGILDGSEVYQFTLIPKARAAVVWGKIVLSVRAKDLMPLAQVFHDEDGVAVKSLTFHDFRDVEGRTVPFTMRMLPLDKPGESTEIRYSSLTYAVELDDAFFSVQNLRSM